MIEVIGILAYKTARGLPYIFVPWKAHFGYLKQKKPPLREAEAGKEEA